MFSTEEVTLAAMRRGRDGMHLFIYVVRNSISPDFQM